MAEILDTACIVAFGTTAVLYPQSTPETAVPIQGIFEKPSILEEVLPGFSSLVRFFVGYLDITPAPQHGDIITIYGTSYDVDDMEVDAVGGATLKLRKRSNTVSKRTMQGTAMITTA